MMENAKSGKNIVPDRFLARFSARFRCARLPYYE